MSDSEAEYEAGGGKTSILPPFDDPKYRAALDGEITEEEAAAFLRDLDSILRMFVDLGFGVDAVQLAIPELAKFSESLEGLADFSGAADSGGGKMGETFNNAARSKAPQKDDEG